MTIMEALYRIDELKPNSYSQTQKIKWLSSLDGLIYTEIIETHEDNPFDTDEGGVNARSLNSLQEDGEEGTAPITPIPSDKVPGYGEDEDLSTVLLVPAPYDDIYVRWLEAQIDYTNGEYGKYNNSIAMYNAAYTAFANYYNRTHMPKGKKFKFF
jgi:hypothetical protein